MCNKTSDTFVALLKVIFALTGATVLGIYSDSVLVTIGIFFLMLALLG